ncbi:MAG: hypothetical protein WC569_02375 [Candidatus Omnitrophota bacterium]
MAKLAKEAIIVMLILNTFTPLPLAASESAVIVNHASSCSFSDWLNGKTQPGPISEKEEKKILREYWKQRLGVDVFYPYFKAKEVESKVSEKSSVRILKLRGKPEIKEDSVKYIFRLKF